MTIGGEDCSLHDPPDGEWELWVSGWINKQNISCTLLWFSLILASWFSWSSWPSWSSWFSWCSWKSRFERSPMRLDLRPMWALWMQECRHRISKIEKRAGSYWNSMIRLTPFSNPLAKRGHLGTSETWNLERGDMRSPWSAAYQIQSCWHMRKSEINKSWNRNLGWGDMSPPWSTPFLVFDFLFLLNSF